jgi:large subunit ribosomal protein L12
LKYVYAALLLHSASKEINEENVKKVLTAAGIKAEDSRVKSLTAALSEIKIEEAIKTATTMSVVQPAQAQAPAPEADPSKEKKEKPKAEEKKEEEALEGLGTLFGE